MAKEQAFTFQQEQEQRIAGWLRKVKFRRKIFGGVSEQDVWKKITELNEMYRQALIAERARCDTLLQVSVAAERKDGEPE